MPYATLTNIQSENNCYLGKQHSIVPQCSPPKSIPEKNAIYAVNSNPENPLHCNPKPKKQM